MLSNKILRKKQMISKEEFSDISDTAAAAEEFLTEPRFAHIRELLTNAKATAEHAIYHNTIHDSQEINVVSEFLTRVFRTSKKENTDELVGQIKLVEKFFADVQTLITIKEDLGREIAEKKVLIER